MARGFNGTTQYAHASPFTIITGVPFSLSCWFRSTDTTNRQVLVGVGDITVENDYYSLEAAGNIAGDPIRAFAKRGAGGSNAATATGYSSGVWHNALALFISSTSRKVYIDGGSEGTNAGSEAVNPTGVLRVGARAALTPTEYTTGRICEVGIWNVTLAPNDIAALAKGIPPYRVNPLNLKGYWPLWGIHSSEIDLSPNNNSMVLLNSPPFATHAPVKRFTPERWAATIPLIEVAGAGANELGAVLMLNNPFGMNQMGAGQVRP